MDLLLTGKRALVTGGSKGIGKAIARQLAREGCDLAVAARNEAEVIAAAAEISAESGRLVVEPKARPRYTLDELLAQCDPSAEPTAEEREWLEAKPSGGELL